MSRSGGVVLLTLLTEGEHARLLSMGPNDHATESIHLLPVLSW